MAELPASWGLKPRKRKDGKLDIVGKDDTGSEYVARTTDASEITERDIQELKEVDRETATARGFVEGLVSHQQKLDAEREQKLHDDFTETTEEIIAACTTNSHATNAGMIDMPLKAGLSASYRRGERYWKEMEIWRQRGCPIDTGEN